MNTEIIKLAAVGDIALTHKYDQLLSAEGPNYPFERVKEFLQDKDIVFGNLEAPLSLIGETFPLKCSLRANPEYALGLKATGFNILSLANNHILDYKEKAFYETLKNLDKRGINWFGAGRDIWEARKPAVLNIRDTKIGFLGYCGVIIDSPFYASDNGRGIAPLKMRCIKEDIRALRNQTDFLVVSLHWGIENWSYPSPKQKRIAHEIIDYGGDLILGHHPHVLQGIEKYKHGYIAYSLGNFIFSEIHWSWETEGGKTVNSTVKWEKPNRESMILLVKLTKNGIVDIDILPCLISQVYQPVIAVNNRFLQKKIAVLSKKISHKNYKTFWHRYALKQRFKTYLVRNIKRFRHIHRLRPAHMKEFLNIIKSIRGAS